MLRIHLTRLLFMVVLGSTLFNIASARDIYECAADRLEPDDYAKFLASEIDETVTPEILDAVVQEGIIQFYGLRNNPPNPKRAIDLFEKATEADYAPAQNILGTLHLTGWGLDQSSSVSAKSYFEKAAEQNYPPAQNNLAVLFWNGWGAKKDMERAEELFRSASDRGYAPAQSNVGLMLKTREENTWGGEEAIKMFRAAQAKNFGPAAFNYATYFLEGKGVERDFDVAAHSLRIAAKAGDPWAQYNLGQMAALGIGVEQDFVEAYKWLMLSKMGGVNYADSQLAAIADFLTEEEISNAKIVLVGTTAVRWNEVFELASNDDIPLLTYDLISLAPELIASRVKCAELMKVDLTSAWTTSFEWNE